MVLIGHCNSIKTEMHILSCYLYLLSKQGARSNDFFVRILAPWLNKIKKKQYFGENLPFNKNLK
jgi:hypothetical protein